MTITDNNIYKFFNPISYYFKFRKSPDQTVTELFGHNVDAKWANIIYVGQMPEKDIIAVESNPRLYNKVKKTISSSGQIQFKNEIFSIIRQR